MSVCLTDKYPNPEAMESSNDLNLAHQAIRYHPESVDVMRVPDELAGFRTLFSAFHHFRPEQARAILGDAVRKHHGIAVFEGTYRSAIAMFLMLLVPLMVAPVIAAIMIRWIFNDQFGIVNVVLEAIGLEGQPWLVQRWSAFGIILLTDIWLWTPWFMLLLLAVLPLPAAFLVARGAVSAERVRGALLWGSAATAAIACLHALRAEGARVILVDVHCEATSEKAALAWLLDGKVSAVIGTHTHVQTADARVLPGGTAFITDVGMCGPWDSVIGVRKELVIERFLSARPISFEPAKRDVWLQGAIVDVDDATGRARSIQRVQERLEE